MSNPAARTIVVLVALAAMATAGYTVYQTHARVRAERESAEAFAGEAGRAAVLIERLRAAQQAYVAEGQGPEFWMKRADEVFGSLEQTFAALLANATTETVRASVQRARDELAAIRTLDRRAREYVDSGQRLMASDLIFTESLGGLASLSGAIDAARAEHAGDHGIRRLEQQQVYALGAAAAVSLLALLLLAPRPAPARPADTREALRALIQEPAVPAGGLTLRPEPAAVPAAPPAPVSRATPSRHVASSIDLVSTAQLCGQLARVLDPADLPGLLQQAARLLNASGLIVWVADRAGTSLFPTLAHGYAPGVLARMGSIPHDADNAAATAYRLAERQVVPAGASGPGALVTPIVTAEGCVGVLAAETRDASEQDESTHAVAEILAAQLATFVTALPGRSEEAAG